MSSREFLGIFPLLSLKYRSDEEATKERSRAGGSAGRQTRVKLNARPSSANRVSLGPIFTPRVDLGIKRTTKACFKERPIGLIIKIFK